MYWTVQSGLNAFHFETTVDTYLELSILGSLKFKQDFCIVLEFTSLSAQNLKGWRKSQGHKTCKNLTSLWRINMISDFPYLYGLLFSLSAFYTVFNVGRDSHAQDWIPLEELLLYINPGACRSKYRSWSNFFTCLLFFLFFFFLFFLFFPGATTGKALQKYFRVNIFELLILHRKPGSPVDDPVLEQSFFAAFSLMCKTAVFALKSLCPRTVTGMLFSWYIDLRTKACCKMRWS